MSDPFVRLELFEGLEYIRRQMGILSEMNELYAAAMVAWLEGAEAAEYKCVGGHDACGQMYPCEECPCCERILHPTLQAIQDFYNENHPNNRI